MLITADDKSRRRFVHKPKRHFALQNKPRKERIFSKNHFYVKSPKAEFTEDDSTRVLKRKGRWSGNQASGSVLSGIMSS